MYSMCIIATVESNCAWTSANYKGRTLTSADNPLPSGAVKIPDATTE